MKAIRYILLFSFALIVFGILSKMFIALPGGNITLILGVLILVTFSPIYGIIAFIKKRHRIEASMLVIPIILYLGFLFKLMYWPGGNQMVIVGSINTTIFSIVIFIYCLVTKRKIRESILYIILGYYSLSYCFKSLYWPGAEELVIASVISMIIGIIVVLIKFRENPTTHTVVSGVLILIFTILLVTKESTLYKRTRIQTENKALNHPEKYYEYAWLLYNEGSHLRAKTNLEYAIEQTQNPNNQYYDSPYFLEYKEEYIKIFNEAIEQVQQRNWRVQKWPN